jgi:hypothetical protein
MPKIYNADRTAEQIPYPYVNLNGDSAETLVEDRLGTLKALQKALEFLGAQYPNGRNYQTAPAGAYETARRIHEDQMAGLRLMVKEITAEALFIQECQS